MTSVGGTASKSVLRLIFICFSMIMSLQGCAVSGDSGSAGLQSSLTQANVQSLSNIELSVLVHKYRKNTRQPNEPLSILLREAERREIISVREFLRSSQSGIVRLGSSVYASIMNNGMPTHIAEHELRRGGRVLALYHYRSLILLESRQVQFISGGRLIGFSVLNRQGNNFSWAENGVQPVRYWKPAASTMELFTAPSGVIYCGGSGRDTCMSILVQSYG